MENTSHVLWRLQFIRTCLELFYELGGMKRSFLEGTCIVGELIPRYTAWFRSKCISRLSLTCFTIITPLFLVATRIYLFFDLFAELLPIQPRLRWTTRDIDFRTEWDECKFETLPIIERECYAIILLGAAI